MNAITTSRNYSFTTPRTYIAAAAFILGNIIVPQLIHLVPGGGLTWLPIYFFTLIGAWACGWRVGLMTAILSPLINSMLFGMPAYAALPAIMLKSVLLALSASYASHRTTRPTILALAAVVIGYQTLGTLAEWAICGSLTAALSDLTTGLPGITFQIVAGYALLRSIYGNHQ